MTAVRLSKLHATGNDFLVWSWLDLDAPRGERRIDNTLAARLCDRHTGVGADGLIVVKDSIEADAEMLLYNADGGIAEMSGNGIRALAWVAARNGLGA